MVWFKGNPSYVALFTLASLCRYYPERWSPFVMKDTTGEKVLIEKFLYFARRLIPNYVLNMQTAVTAFKNGTVYKALISSNFTKIFSKLDVGSMHILVDTLEKDINKSLGEDVSTDLKKFSLKLGSGYNSAADAMLAFSVSVCCKFDRCDPCSSGGMSGSRRWYLQPSSRRP